MKNTTATKNSSVAKNYISLVDKIKKACQKQNKIAMITGFIFGFLPPLASFELIDNEVQQYSYMWIVVAACLMYSAISVWSTAKIAFNNGWKAFAYVVLMEGILAFSHIMWLRVIILGLLIVINGISSGCDIALDQKKK